MVWTGTRVKIIFTFIGILLLFSSLHVYINYQSTWRSVISSLQLQSLNTAREISKTIDPQLYLHISAKPRETKEFWAFCESLYKLRISTGYLYLNTINQWPDGRYVYVADGQPPEVILQYPVADYVGEEFSKVNLDKVWAGGIYQSGLIDDSEYGLYFATLVPIFQKDGDVIGILELDTSASDVQKLFSEVWQRDLLLTGVIDLMMLILLIGITVWIFRFQERANRTLQEKNMELEFAQVALEAKSVELSRQKERLEQLNELKDQILANTSHELRTPLNGIIGLADSLLGGAAGSLDPFVQKNLQFIVSSGKRLEALVNDILDISKMKQQKLSLNRKMTGLSHAVDRAVAEIQPTVGTKPVRIYNRIPQESIDDVAGGSENGILIFADEKLFHKLLVHLLANAVKFTHEGTIEVNAVQDERAVTVTVSDTGIGIPFERLQDVFHEFEQLNGSADRHYGGTGLGLAICKRIVEMHGGSIAVASEEGEWTSVSFTFPYPDKHSFLLKDPLIVLDPLIDQELQIAALADGVELISSAPAQGGTAVTDQPVHVLIVDDDQMNILILTNFLRMNGIRVSAAANGAEAVSLLEPPADAPLPDVVIMDIVMPGMSGYETVEKLRHHFPRELLPVIYLTAKEEEDEIERGFASGANDYLVKPFQKKDLLSRIHCHAAIARTWRENHGKSIPSS